MKITLATLIFSAAFISSANASRREMTCFLANDSHPAYQVVLSDLGVNYPDEVMVNILKTNSTGYWQNGILKSFTALGSTTTLLSSPSPYNIMRASINSKKQISFQLGLYNRVTDHASDWTSTYFCKNMWFKTPSSWKNKVTRDSALYAEFLLVSFVPVQLPSYPRKILFIRWERCEKIFLNLHGKVHFIDQPIMWTFLDKAVGTSIIFSKSTDFYLLK